VSVEVLDELKKLKNQLSGKFEQTRGVRVWGEMPDGTIGLLQLSAEGKLLVDAIASITGKVSVENFPSDYPASGTESRLDSLLAELQGKLETTDLAIQAVTKYLQTRVENFPTDFPDATSQSTLSGIKGQTDKLTFEAVTNKLLVKSTRDWTITESLAVGSYPGPGSGQLPSSLTALGNLKAAIQEALPAGTNNIGDVDVLTLPTLPTGDNWIGRVKVGDGTNALAIPLAGDAVGRGIFIFGSDYSAAPGPYARLPKVDSEGNLYIKSV